MTTAGRRVSEADAHALLLRKLGRAIARQWRMAFTFDRHVRQYGRFEIRGLQR